MGALGDAVARHVSAEVDHVKRHAALLERLEHVEGIQGGAEAAIQLRGDNHVESRAAVTRPR
jgi:hypothetical protein